MRINLATNNNGMEACMMRSKISMGRESVPFASILSFCHRCGSGVNGASPKAIAAITSAVSGILSSQSSSPTPLRCVRLVIENVALLRFATFVLS